jgi:hypothetical protein
MDSNRETKASKLEPRIAQQRMRELETTIALLHAASRAMKRVKHSPQPIETEINRLTDELNLLRQQRQLPVLSRQRPKMVDRDEHSKRRIWDVFLDESGHRDPKPQAAFPIFCVAAVVVEREHYRNVVIPGMQRIKESFWPGEEIVFHEPNIRRRRGKFFFGGDEERQEQFDSEYENLLSTTDMRIVGAVIDKANLRKIYGGLQIDQYLPRAIYAMAYDFVLERVCNLLHFECDDAVGAMFPESVGKREDAELQLEHARMFVDGTRYVPGAWFQYQLRPGLRFYTKGESEGIEIADTVARTIADHYNGAGEGAIRWNCLASKMYCGHMDREVKWGCYKVFPASQE